MKSDVVVKVMGIIAISAFFILSLIFIFQDSRYPSILKHSTPIKTILVEDGSKWSVDDKTGITKIIPYRELNQIWFEIRNGEVLHARVNGRLVNVIEY